jgi:hypothetical protein
LLVVCGRRRIERGPQLLRRRAVAVGRSVGAAAITGTSTITAGTIGVPRGHLAALPLSLVIAR